MTCGIQLCCGKNVGQEIVVGINVKIQPIEVLVEHLNHSPFKSEKLQFVGWVMGFSLGQTTAGIGYNGISPIIMGVG